MAIPDRVLRELPTPCYVVDAPHLRSKLQQLTKAFESFFPRLQIAVSYKTASLPALLEVTHAAGALSEIVSLPEYDLATRLGASGGRCVVNGPAKPRELLSRALAEGAQVNVDSLRELELAALLAREQEHCAPIGLRIALAKPEPGSGRQVSRFGLEIGEELDRARQFLATNRDVRLVGLHAHVASRGRTVESYRQLARQLNSAFDRLGAPRLERIDLGGGYPWPHPQMPEPSFRPLEDYASAMSEELDPRLLHPELVTVVEPGIALVNDCVTCLCSVLDLKLRREARIAVIDGSVHLVKPTLHRLNLPTRLIEPDATERERETYDLTGYTCLEFDVIAEDILLPKLREGDRLAIDNVGAYTFVFKPQFIQPRPPFYLWDDDGMKLARRAERFEEMYFDG